MEYESPGAWMWTKLLVTLIILGNTQMFRVDGKHHRIRHHHFNPPESYQGHREQHFYDMDYEDSTVMLQPEFINTRTNITVVEGSMATLPCSVRYLGTKQVAWRLLGAKDDHFLTVGAFTWVRENNIQVDYKAEGGQITHWNLIIKSVKLSDQGTYQCQITDKVPIRTHVYLVVKKRAEREPTVTITGKSFVDGNEPIHLQCNATGGPRIPEEIDWFKDGSKIVETNPKYKGFIITKYRSLEYDALISDLRIDKSDESDTGNYICRSSDKMVVSRKVTVLVAADTQNVKRGTGSKEEQITGARPSESYGNLNDNKPGGNDASRCSTFLSLVILTSLISSVASSLL